MEQATYRNDGNVNSFNRIYVPTTRFTISPSVRLPYSEVDFHTGLPKTGHYRRRTQSTRLDQEWNNEQQQSLWDTYMREAKKKGIRISRRVLILSISSIVFVLCMIVLGKIGSIAYARNEINDIEESVSYYQKINQELLEEIDRNSTEAVIMTAARDRLGMVRRSDRDSIHLLAPATRPLVQTESWAVSGTLPDIQN